MGPSRIKVIPNGVDVRRYRRARERRDARRELSLPDSCSHVLAIVGRLEEQKGHRFLLDAIQHLRGTFPGVCVLVAGDGSLRADLQEKAQTLGIERHVRFLGHCGNIQSVLDASDVFVLSSLWEALPFALLEAMASGLPIVATAVAGVPELVLHGETGFLVQPADPTGLASALRTLMASEELRASMGMAGQERVEREFSQRSMLAKTEETYRELLKPTCR
ncbi:MAG TPA: glycosyltransferase [Tepidisphaeraceae bacterium]|jgi:glycosyltransferase involved in cell wall biosynthesis